MCYMLKESIVKKENVLYSKKCDILHNKLKLFMSSPATGWRPV